MASCQCGRRFPNLSALQQHRSALHHFLCSECNRNFKDSDALKQHHRSTGHCYCRQCNRYFVTSQALGDHLRSALHVTQYRCCDCDREFVNEQALHQHLADKVHKIRTRSSISSATSSDWKCPKCKKDFKDQTGLNQHQSSVIHKPFSNFKCVAHKNCKKQFSCPSAWLHHLESGACRSKITRDSLDNAIHSYDVDRLITQVRIQDYSALLEPSISQSTSPTASVIFTPITDDSYEDDPLSTSLISRSGILTPNTGSSQYWEDSSYTTRLSCPLCPLSRKPFKSLQAMKNHMSSPAHSPKFFHCPITFAGIGDTSEVSQLMKYFSTLSGLMQHLESGACEGGSATFRKTVKYIEKKLRNLGFQQARLLI